MSTVCQRRLQKEFAAIRKSPVSHISAAPNEDNILEWHYCIEGPQGTVYEGGFYWGVLRFPPEYPYKPPSILMFTKNGRFKPSTRLCLSMSDFHQESWNPMWSVASILSGLLSFMLENTSTLGSIDSSDAVRKVLAQNSLNENLKNPTFRKMFPDIVERAKQRTLTSVTSNHLTNKQNTHNNNNNNNNTGDDTMPGTTNNATTNSNNKSDSLPNGQLAPAKKFSFQRYVMLPFILIISAIVAIVAGVFIQRNMIHNS
jgi:ubiquitin-conjugating enzyme E2 J2